MLEWVALCRSSAATVAECPGRSAASGLPRGSQVHNAATMLPPATTTAQTTISLSLPKDSYETPISDDDTQKLFSKAERFFQLFEEKKYPYIWAALDP